MSEFDIKSPGILPLHIENIGDTWPYPLVHDITMKPNVVGWVETNEETYMNQLECLWPAHWEGDFFLVGEPLTHGTFNGEGCMIYTGFLKYKGRYFCRDMPFLNSAIMEFRTHFHMSFR